MAGLIKAFGFSLQYVMDELPMEQGWALLSWSTERTVLSDLERVSPGYIAQEAQRHGQES